MADYPRSLPEFQQLFPGEAECAGYLAEIRWPDGFRCPACGHAHAWALETKAWTYECSKCHRQTSACHQHIVVPHRERYPAKRLIPEAPVPQYVDDKPILPW